MRFMIVDYGSLVGAWTAACAYARANGKGTLYVIGTWINPLGLIVR